MPDTVDDFMNRFGGNQTVTDADAAKYHDRFNSTHPDDSQFAAGTYHQAATEYLGKLPDHEFQGAANQAIAQAPAPEREGLLGSLLGSLGGQAGGLGALGSLLGLGSTDPRQMSNDDATRVLDYARKERPEVLQQTVQEKPWFVKAMGNPIVMGALTMAAAKLLNNRNQR